jgi:2-succinyl-5-enolpyruvyl-6-hydroxy-3-cyclohexene-1-carboxylate synthase
MNDPTDVRNVGAANLKFARALVGELQAAGIASAFVCPGSRSTPLALAIAEHPQLQYSVHVDERSAAFQALGFAKAAGRPVALLCTSGTAGANFLPAVAEAAQSRVPMIVLTADRPPELRAWGAPQTMEQRTLYAGFTRWSEEAPCPSERGAEVAYARALARRAVIEATGIEPGPVHLNLPFREPLLPAVVDVRPPAEGEVAAGFDAAGAQIEATIPESLASDLQQIERGVLLFGPDNWDPSLAAAAHALAVSLGWPIVADPASGLRAGPPLDGAIIHGADLLLRDAEAATTLRPDLIVRFGGQPTSASVVAWMARHAAADVWLVDPANGFRDPQHRASRWLRAGSRQFCELAASAAATAPAPAPRSWQVQWQHADRVARAAASAAIDAEPAFLTPHIARALWTGLPDGAALYVANSMAIREVDMFAGPREANLRLLANRGVNGIDGQVSAALGAAAALRRPTVLWCGDLALLHDVSGLLAGRLQGGDLTIVVSNDDGGGIFEYLPAARLVSRPVFESLFAVPHGLDLRELARGLGWDAVRVDSAATFAPALARALEGGRNLIEVAVDRAANTGFHASLYQRVRDQLQREPIR